MLRLHHTSNDHVTSCEVHFWHTPWDSSKSSKTHKLWMVCHQIFGIHLLSVETNDGRFSHQRMIREWWRSTWQHQVSHVTSGAVTSHQCLRSRRFRALCQLCPEWCNFGASFELITKCVVKKKIASETETLRKCGGCPCVLALGLGVSTAASI